MEGMWGGERDTGGKAVRVLVCSGRGDQGKR